MPQIQKALQTLRKKKAKKITPKHVTVKLLETKEEKFKHPEEKEVT